MKKVSLMVALVLALGFSPVAFASTTLVLTGICTTNPSTVLNWSVDNTANGVDVPFTWDRMGLENGTGTVLASSTATFSTGTNASSTVPDVVSLSWADTASSTATTTATANFAVCPVAVAPVTSAPVEGPISGIGGHRHTTAQMIAEGLFAPGTVLAGDAVQSTDDNSTLASLYEQAISILTQEIALLEQK